MTKEALWRLLCSRNPLMAKGGSMPAAGYKKFFDLVWCEAQKEFVARQPTSVSNPFPEIFRSKKRGSTEDI